MQPKIRILFTIPNFETAGSTKVLYDLVKGLDPNRFDVFIACEHDRGDFFKEVEQLGFPIYIQKFTTHYKPYISLWWRINPWVRFLKEHKVDIVHSWHWSSDWTEALGARKAGVRYVFTKKAMSWGNKHWKLRSFLAHFIFTINHEMHDYFPWKKNQKLVPLGIDTDYYSPDAVKPCASSGKFRIITVANLVPVKGIEVLLQALNLVPHQDMELFIVGGSDPNYFTYLTEEIKRLGLENVVHFMGKQADVRPYLSSANLYVIPTLDQGRKEGMPMALVEAMSMEIPVLGSNISGINFVLKDFPQLLFKAGNVDQLAEKLREMAKRDSEKRRNLGIELRDYCLQHFTMEKFLFQSETIYKKLVFGKTE